MSAQSDIINRLIEVNTDARTFYESAADQVKDPIIEGIFRDMAKIRGDIVLNLSSMVQALGEEPSQKSTLTGDTVQFFGELLAKISPDTDRALVEQLEEAEDKALREFSDALEKPIDPELRLALSNQMDTLVVTHDYMKTLKHEVQAAA